MKRTEMFVFGIIFLIMAGITQIESFVIISQIWIVGSILHN